MRDVYRWKRGPSEPVSKPTPPDQGRACGSAGACSRCLPPRLAQACSPHTPRASRFEAQARPLPYITTSDCHPERSPASWPFPRFSRARDAARDLPFAAVYPSACIAVRGADRNLTACMETARYQDGFSRVCVYALALGGRANARRLPVEAWAFRPAKKLARSTGFSPGPISA